MKVIQGISKIKRPFKKAVVTVGIFDGVHIGHQFILKKVIWKAKRIKGKSVVITFNPHPLKILNPHNPPALLTSLNHRINLIARLGVDVCLVMNFTKRFCCLPSEDFIRDTLVRKIGMREIFVGDNFRFGCKQEGDIELLRGMSERFGFRVNCVNPVRNINFCKGKSKIFYPVRKNFSNGVNIVKSNDNIISSTQIRRLIERGKINEAAHFLGRSVSILGTVIEGSARGRWIGYPTANVDPHQEAIPPSGVYAVEVKIGRQGFFGILNIGRRPTFSYPKKKPAIEVHIFNFREDIYGKELEISFIRKIRAERKFLSSQQLTEQIERDCLKAKKLLRLLP